MRCCICKKEFVGFGNNPYPLCHKDDFDSRCCDDCNNFVIQARFDMSFKGMSLVDVQKKYLGKECKMKKGRKQDVR